MVIMQLLSPVAKMSLSGLVKAVSEKFFTHISWLSVVVVLSYTGTDGLGMKSK